MPQKRRRKPKKKPRAEKEENEQTEQPEQPNIIESQKQTNKRKENLRAKLKAKIEAKRVGRLSAEARESKIEEIEDMMCNATGIEKKKLREIRKEIEKIDEKEFNSMMTKTMPEYVYE